MLVTTGVALATVVNPCRTTTEAEEAEEAEGAEGAPLVTVTVTSCAQEEACCQAGAEEFTDEMARKEWGKGVSTQRSHSAVALVTRHVTGTASADGRAVPLGNTAVGV